MYKTNTMVDIYMIVSDLQYTVNLFLSVNNWSATFAGNIKRWSFFYIKVKGTDDFTLK